MHQLVAQRVQAHKHLVQHALGVLLRQGALHALAGIGEGIAPMRGRAAIAARVVERVPERLKHKLVVQQDADRAGKHLPHQRRQHLVGVQPAHLTHKIAKRLAFGSAVHAAHRVLGIGGVEGNPQADESHIVIATGVARCLCALQPAQGTVHAQREGVALLCHQRLVALGEVGKAVF